MKVIARKNGTVEIGDIVSYKNYLNEYMVIPGDKIVYLLNLTTFGRIKLNDTQLDEHVKDGTVKLLIKHDDIIITDHE
ncbi:hypothetical protein HMPREF1639_07275 [Peptostreptococcus sp. MV1]|uniref:hypothetical protein n=1 Tax=Peptostreptococcus sp. MV1 TaxID=1219626 RepID=UPI00050E1295|nr:hypothetical protein [Peptostreptococcus sp. MV1]KGF11401.1 hypothetical protein HMPREF1639_07275 [Peptostreptococcus sp. MV1]